MSAVATVGIEIDARSAITQLRQLQGQSQATQQASARLQAEISQLRAASEKAQGRFASAAEIQAVFSTKVINTERAVRTQIAALEDLRSKVVLHGSDYQKATAQIAQYESILKRTENTQKAATASNAALIGSLRNLAVTYLGLRTAQEAIQAGIQRTESERRLTFLAKGYGEVAAAQEAAARAGRQFGLSTTESNQQFAQLYGRLRPLNVTLTDIEAAFVGFNTSAKVSGTTAAESAGALLQLTQALGSGVLRGQELNSVLEQAPGLVVALTRELGVPITQIRKLAEEGKITSDVVIRALKRAGDEGAGQLAEAMKGPAQAVKNLQNEFENLQIAFSQQLMPEMISSLQVLTRLLNAIAPIVKGIGAVAGPVVGYITSLIEKATGLEQSRFKARMQQQAGASRLARAGVGRTYSDAQGNVYSTITGRLVTTAPTRTAAQAGLQIGAVVGGGSTGGGGGKGRTGKTDAEKAAEKVAEAARKAKEEEDRIQGVLRSRAAEVDMFDLRFQIQTKINKAEKDGDQMLTARLRGAQKELDLQYQYAQLLADPQNKDARIQEQIAYQGRIEILSNQILIERELEDIQKRRNQDQMDGLKAAIEKQYQLNTAVQQQLQIADGISNTIGQGMNSALNLLVSGTENWGDSLRTIASGVLTDIANQLIRIFVIEQAVNAIKSFLTPFSPATPIGAGGGMIGKFGTLGPNYGIPQRAMGGPVTAGQPYMVGERGPELFVPSSGGSIVPNGQAGGGGVAVTVNVDAKGTSVEGSNQQASQLGRIVAAAVQAELVNQRRRGGLLNS